MKTILNKRIEKTIKLFSVLILIISILSCEKHNPAPLKIKQISTGNGFTLLLFENGDVYGAGFSSLNSPMVHQNGTRASAYNQFRIIGSGVTKIKAAGFAAFFLLTNGNLMASGSNDYYSLSNSTNTITTDGVTRWTLVDVNVADFDASERHLYTKNATTGKIKLAGYNSVRILPYIFTDNIPFLSGNTDTIKEVHLGNNCAFLRHNYFTGDRIFYGIGNNFDGNLGVGDQSERHFADLAEIRIGNDAVDIKKISSSNGHTLLLTHSGQLFATGNNSNGYFGNGTNTSSQRFIFITDNVKDIATGLYHSMILKNDNTAWITGRNLGGVLGMGLENDRSINTFTKVAENVELIEANYQQSFFVTKDNRLYAAGTNITDELGINLAIASIPLFQEVPISFPE